MCNLTLELINIFILSKLHIQIQNVLFDTKIVSGSRNNMNIRSVHGATKNVMQGESTEKNVDYF